MKIGQLLKIYFDQTYFLKCNSEKIKLFYGGGQQGHQDRDRKIMIRCPLAYDLSVTSSEDEEDKGQDDGGGQQGH